MSVPATDPEGFLVNPFDWNEEWARRTARAENLELSDEHWIALKFMRDFLDRNQVPPDARFAVRHLAQKCGAWRNRLFELFPYGYVQQACKIGGMRRPRMWSTG